MDFEFGQNNNRVQPDEGSLCILEKRERWRIQGLPNFFEYPYYLRNG